MNWIFCNRGMGNRNAYIVRLVRIDDINDYFRLASNNRPALEGVDSELPSLTNTKEDTILYLAYCVSEAERNNEFVFVIEDLACKRIIGSVQVKMRGGMVRRAEMGYFADAGYGGREVLVRAVGEVVDFCWSTLRLNHLFIQLHENNRKGRAVAEKNGFAFGGILKNCCLAGKEQTVNIAQYGLVNPSMQ
jgi:RimJ/RimL family protein N-acetyltransferase